MRTAEAFTRCSHGWTMKHCIRDNEGSCPIPNHEWETAECRCNESEYLTLREQPDGSWLESEDEQ